MKTPRLSIIVLGLTIPSCYEFNFPLDPTPKVPQDARLAGVWRCLSAHPSVDEGAATLRIEPRPGLLAHWTFETPSSDGTTDQGEFDVYRSSQLGGSLLNAMESGGKEPRKWSFVRYSLLTPDVLRIELMDDEPFDKVKDNAEALRQAITRRVNDPAIYKDFCVCVRATPAAEPSSSPFS